MDYDEALQAHAAVGSILLLTVQLLGVGELAVGSRSTNTPGDMPVCNCLAEGVEGVIAPRQPCHWALTTVLVAMTGAALVSFNGEGGAWL